MSETTPEYTFPARWSRQWLRFKIGEYTDLFWFDVLGRLPVCGDRLKDYRSDYNMRRG